LADFLEELASALASLYEGETRRWPADGQDQTGESPAASEIDGFLGHGPARLLGNVGEAQAVFDHGRQRPRSNQSSALRFGQPTNQRIDDRTVTHQPTLDRFALGGSPG
jgi:hypothetical protein